MSFKKEGFGKYLGSTTLISLGFFTMGLMDILYDTYVPIFLGKYMTSNALVGFIMTLDNIFAIFLIPMMFYVIAKLVQRKAPSAPAGKEDGAHE